MSFDVIYRASGSADNNDDDNFPHFIEYIDCGIIITLINTQFVIYQWLKVVNKKTTSKQQSKFENAIAFFYLNYECVQWLHAPLYCTSTVIPKKKTHQKILHQDKMQCE